MKNILYILITVLIFAFTLSAQVQVKYYPSLVKMTWDLDTSGDVSEYFIFYVQAEDSAMISSFFYDGALYDDIWGWRFASTIYNEFNLTIKEFPLPVTSYFVRVGIMAAGFNGQKSPLRVSRFIRVRNIVLPSEIGIH